MICARKPVRSSPSSTAGRLYLHQRWVPHPRRAFVFAPRVGYHIPPSQRTKSRGQSLGTAGLRFQPGTAENGQPRQGCSPGRGCRLVLQINSAGRSCKPNSVVCGHSSRRRVAAGIHQRPTRRFRQQLEPPGRIGPMRSAAGLDAGASLPIWSCSVWGLPCPRRYRRGGALLPHHFTLTPALDTGKLGEPDSPSREALPKEG